MALETARVCGTPGVSERLVPTPHGFGSPGGSLPATVLTRGTAKPLRLTPDVQPKGSDTPSSYSAGSQRAKARLEAPSVGLRLRGTQGADSGQHGGDDEDRDRDRGQDAALSPTRAPPVVAVASDGAIFVPLWAPHPHVLVGAATRLGQQIQLSLCEHICKRRGRAKTSISCSRKQDWISQAPWSWGHRLRSGGMLGCL